MRRPPLTFLDLFAGCGGITRGFKDAGFRLVAGVEWDRAAAATFASNFGKGRTVWGGVESLIKVPEVDVVVGGPPCQGFSNLGRRDPLDERNQLWLEFVRIVAESKCRAFVLENVDQFKKSTEYERLLLEATPGGLLDGFHIRKLELNAADFGVPQLRRRTLIVGCRLAVPLVPTHTHSKDGSGRTEAWRTVRSAIGELRYSGLPTALPNRKFEIGDSTTPGGFSLEEIHVGRTYQPKSLERYAHVAPGRSRFDLPEHLKYDCWKVHLTGSADVLGRLEWSKPSVTIRTEFFKPEKGRYLHPEWHANGSQVNRALTHAEAALIQGFDNRHTWCGSKVEIARQIGNAVPPPMAAAVARSVKEQLRSADPEASRQEDFDQPLAG